MELHFHISQSDARSQGVDVSRVLSHFRTLSQGTSSRNPTLSPKTAAVYAKTKHVTVFEAYDEGSSEETDPLSSSESSYAESDKSFTTSSMVYSNTNNRNNNITMNNNNNNLRQKDAISPAPDEPDALKRDHVFVKFAESQEMKEVLQLHSDLKSELGLENQPSTFVGQFHNMKQGLVGKVPDR